MRHLSYFVFTYIFTILFAGVVNADPGTAFTYQGRLADGATAIEVPVDLQFTLWDGGTTGSQIGAPILFPNTAYDGGIVQRDLNFGTGAFNGDPRWLQIQLANPAGSALTTLTPRIQILPAPYAMYAARTGTVIGDGDTTSTNELNTALLLNGMNLELADAGGTLTADLSPLAGGLFGDGHSLDAVDGSPVDTVFVDADGEVGIGTTTPSSALEIFGDITLSGNEVVDQTQLVQTGLFATTINRQSFQPGISGLLTAIEIFTSSLNTSTSGTLTIFDGPNASSPVLTSQVFNVIPGVTQGQKIRVLNPPTVVAGQSYTFDFTRGSAGTQAFATGSGDPYPNGIGFFFPAGFDNTFRTFVVPNPGAIRFSDGTMQTTANDDWSLVGNASTIPGTNFIGTTDNQSLDFRVNNRRALRLEPAASGGLPNIVGGFDENIITGAGSVIAGGGEVTRINQISTNGGAIGGGRSNNVSGAFGTIPGGQFNEAGGFASFAAGNRAVVRSSTQSGDGDGDEGTFVWSDTSGPFFSSTGPNQFLVRAAGGVGINKNNPTSELDVAGTITATKFIGDGSMLTGIIDNVIDADANPSNELNTGLALNGMNLELADAGGTLTADLSPLAGSVFGDGHSLNAVDGSPVDAVFVDADGEVGIGTTTPSSALEVIGDINLPSIEQVDQAQLLQGVPAATSVNRQSFQPEISGLLTAIEIFTSSINTSTSGTLTIFDGPNAGSPVLTSQVFNVIPGVTQGQKISILNSPTVVAGQSYTFDFTRGSAGVQRFSIANGDPYPNGIAFFLPAGIDHAFRTFVVPDPGAIRFSDGSIQTSAFTGVVNDADSSPTNELNTSLILSGMNLELTDAGGTLITDLSPLAGSVFGDGHSLDAVDGSPVDAVFIDADGEVGIGTTTPTSALDVAGTITATNIRLDGVEQVDISQLTITAALGGGGLHGQTFRPTQTGLLTAVEVRINAPTTAASATLRFGEVIGGGNSILTSQIVNITPGSTNITKINLESPQLVSAGTEYYFDLTPTSGTIIYTGANTNPYPDGAYLANGPVPSADLYFQTYMKLSVINFPDGTSIVSANLFDSSPTNELNTSLSLNGTTLELVDAGTTLTSNLSSLVDDADADPNNEIQNLWRTFVADSGLTNANRPNDVLGVIGAGIVSTSIVGDDLTISATELDGSTSNEIQTLGYNSANGSLSISSANSVDINGGGYIISSNLGDSQDNFVANTPVGNTFNGDDVVQSVSFGFNFVIEGVTYIDAAVSTNGWLEFGGPVVDADFFNGALPDAGHSQPFLAAYWDDLVSTVYWKTVGTAPNRVCQIYFDSATLTGNNNIDFIVSLHEGSGIIQTRYTNIGPFSRGLSATIGFQKAGGSAAVAYPISFDAPVLDDNSSDADPSDQSWSIAPIR
jgi:hypothetical protein